MLGFNLGFHTRQVTRRTGILLQHFHKMPARPKRKAVDATAEKAKRAKGETNLKWDLKWTNAGNPDKNGIHPLLVLSSDSLKGSTKIAGFDIDFTVIQTKSGRKFATGKKLIPNL